MHPSSAVHPAVALPSRLAARLHLGAPALQDVVILAYLAVVAALLWARAPAWGPPPVIHAVYAGFALLAATAVVARAVPEVPLRVRLSAYRIVLVGAILGGYLMLRDVLPAIRPDSVDASLAAADARIFGGQPVLWLERLDRRPIVEWLSFFYFNYYTLQLAFVIGVLWIARPGPLAAEYCLGTALVYCLGHLGYLAVPAYGPAVFFAERFHEPLHGGPWLALVLRGVASGGALKDVFPSMHTGASAWLALFALRQARLDRRWRWPAALTCFFAANIVVSTIVLRWHYAVDVVAGLVLAALVAGAAARLPRWEEARRRRLGHAPVWTFG